MRAFFTRRAPRYDRIADGEFWAFSDRLLWALLSARLLPALGAGPVRFLDAGGGTGRWSLRLLSALPGATGVLVDVSEGMLAVAREKARRRRAADRLSLVSHDLHRPIPRSLGRFDLALCFHNVAGLVADPAALLCRIAAAVRPGGHVAVVAPNLHQAAWVSVRDGRLAELKRLRDRSAVKYGPGVPEVLVFTPSLLRDCLRRAGADEIEVFGFPVSVSPVDPDESLPPSLSDPRARARLLPLEAALCQDEEVSPRGNSLLAIARLPGRAPSRRARPGPPASG